MAHFAKVINGVVTQVIRAEEEFFESFIDNTPGDWIQTSYNSSIRNKFAAIGDNYDRENDVFYPPKPSTYVSWSLNKSTWVWEAPIAYPTDGAVYDWNEPEQKWVKNSNYPETPYPKDGNEYTWNKTTKQWELIV